MMKTSTRRLALLLALAPFAACKCGPVLYGNSENLNCPPWDAGAIGVSYLEHSAPGAMELQATGNSNVLITSIQIIDDGGGFSLDDAGAVTSVNVGATSILGLRFTPKQPGLDIAQVIIDTDNGPCTTQAIGVGIDECAAINLDGGCDAGVNNCQGTCTNGACQWPSSGMCADGTQCITGGTCNGIGGCAGPSSCVPTGTCNGNNYTGQIATNPDGTGTCNPSSNPNVPGQCLFTSESVTCDCGCGTLPNNSTGCLYNWTLDATSPKKAFGSLWASQAGDVWASLSTGAAQGNTVPMAIYERQNGTWNQATTIPLGSNPLSGAGGTIALTGDQSGTLYAASACSFKDSAGNCGDAGMWKYKAGVATFEAFAPNTYSNACGNTADFAMSYPVMIGGSEPAVLNSDPCGPEVMTENAGLFTVQGGSQVATHCSQLGALWGMAPNDLYIAWGCTMGGAGGIWHFTGQTLNASSPDFKFPSNMDNAEAIAGVSSTEIMAVGTQRWHNDGSGWTSTGTAPANNPDTSLWSVGDGTYFASGNYSGVYHYASGSWTLECLAPGYQGNDPNVYQVAGDAHGNFYAASQNGIFKRQ